jgi:hypothetical protein
VDFADSVCRKKAQKSTNLLRRVSPREGLSFPKQKNRNHFLIPAFAFKAQPLTGAIFPIPNGHLLSANIRRPRQNFFRVLRQN